MSKINDSEEKKYYMVKYLWERGEFYFEWMTEEEANKLRKHGRGSFTVEERTP